AQRATMDAVRGKLKTLRDTLEAEEGKLLAAHTSVCEAVATLQPRLEPRTDVLAATEHAGYLWKKIVHRRPSPATWQRVFVVLANGRLEYRFYSRPRMVSASSTAGSTG